MATFAYALRTKQRESAEPGTSTTTSSPGSTTWLDAMAALVPAEVLAIHMFAVSKLTESVEVAEGGSVSVTAPRQGAEEVEAAVDDETVVTVISDPYALKVTFWALLVFSAVIYIYKAWSNFNRLDMVRLFIPPAAFVLWTMLMPDSAFDAVFPGALTEVRRELFAVIGAGVLGFLAKALADQADKQQPAPEAARDAEPARRR